MPRLGPVMGASEAFHARMPNGPANQMSQPQSVPIQLLHLSDEFVQQKVNRTIGRLHEQAITASSSIPTKFETQVQHKAAHAHDADIREQHVHRYILTR